ncbi:MFS transporter [Epidermidibacterium keratini]|uniref:MFS transporter n=1 Tax=Epidermidibacterium keratini TaxID=1891644 RepID=A0A7L4YM11_9ACTN|nr:MFS transporter [Epidermidibacterium keratini]QHB99586.1 MFS transporter [Epidermidibacterium keratini]
MSLSSPTASPAPTAGRRGPHRAWYVAIVTFIALIGAAGFRSVPSVLMEPLNREFGWSHGTIGAAVSVNLLLFGLFSPFAAALMDRFGIRRVVATALLLIAVGSGLTVFMTSAWQLLLLWGVVIGLGTGSISMAFMATVVSRWFIARRGLISGILTAAGATGQLIFLPLVANLAMSYGWRVPALAVAGAALLVVPLVIVFLRDHPHDVGLEAYGATEAEPTPPRSVAAGSSARRALVALRDAARTRTFWFLAAGFAICGASTNGLIGTHFVPAAHDHGMPATTAAGLLALIGVFDIGGTVLSGWLTDRVDSRWLLVIYYTLRGGSLLLLPSLLGPTTEPPIWAFIIFYGLDWVATVPPTVAICRQQFGDRGPIVFGWVFASHQIGAAIAAVGAGVIRDISGAYTLAFMIAGGLCFAAAVMSYLIRTPSSPAAELVAAREL